MKPKILIIAGPTAVGKTSLALSVAQQVPSIIISSDSRQVYQGLDLITGKDIPSDFKKTYSNFNYNHSPIPIYQNSYTSIYGYDLVKPDQSWSVAQFFDFSKQLIEHLKAQNKLFIFVGGTGLYLKNLLSPSPNLLIPPNPILRQELSSLSLSQLQQRLRKANLQHFNSLNHSDKNNPRRLVRALEVTHFQNNHHYYPPQPLDADFFPLLLTAPKSYLNKKIYSRVHKRFYQPWQKELDYLLSFNLPRTQSAATSLGYLQLHQFQNHELSQVQALTDWITKETQYAGRQLTWFKSNTKDFQAFDPAQQDPRSQIVPAIKAWYIKNQ